MALTSETNIDTIKFIKEHCGSAFENEAQINLLAGSGCHEQIKQGNQKQLASTWRLKLNSLLNSAAKSYRWWYHGRSVAWVPGLGQVWGGAFNCIHNGWAN